MDPHFFNSVRYGYLYYHLQLTFLCYQKWKTFADEARKVHPEAFGHIMNLHMMYSTLWACRLT